MKNGICNHEQERSIILSNRRTREGKFNQYRKMSILEFLDMEEKKREGRKAFAERFYRTNANYNSDDF